MKPENSQITKFISVAAVAKRFGVSKSAVYQGKSGLSELTKYRFGKSVRFELAEVEKFEKTLMSRQRSARNKK